MNIQWYPGHMRKAGREIKATLAQVDVVIEILDARLPYSSLNPFLARLRRGKPCIKVLNKCDLADPATTLTWQQFWELDNNTKTLAVSKNDVGKIRLIPDLCRKLAANRHQDRTIHALIMGIPNVGKSTIINILAGRAIAKTGNEPAVTKQQQRIQIADDIVLLDTPGMLWPNIENPHSGYRLAATGSIKDTAISHEDIAHYCLAYLRQHYPNNLVARFNLENLPSDSLGLLVAIGSKRGCLRPGGKVDLDKASKIVLTELRAGLLGRISLETPEMMAIELAEVDRIRQETAEKKQMRNSERNQ